MNRPFVAQRPVQKQQVPVAGTKAQQLLKARALLNAAAVKDHVGKRPPPPAPSLVVRVVFHGVDQPLGAVDLGGGEDVDVQPHCLSFLDHMLVDMPFLQLFPFIQVKRHNT